MNNQEEEQNNNTLINNRIFQKKVVTLHYRKEENIINPLNIIIMLQLSASEEQTLEYIPESIKDNINEYVSDMEMYTTSEDMMLMLTEQELKDLASILYQIQP